MIEKIIDLPGENVTPDNSVVPIYLIPPTVEELAERAEWTKNMIETTGAEQAQAALKESALAKLAKLGLTEDEAKAVIGL